MTDRRGANSGVPSVFLCLIHIAFSKLPHQIMLASQPIFERITILVRAQVVPAMFLPILGSAEEILRLGRLQDES